MTSGNVQRLQEFGEVLGAAIVGLRWRLRGSTIRADLPNPCVRIVIGCSGNFGRALCGGLPSASPVELLELSSTLRGPARFTLTLSQANRLESSWPLGLEPLSQAEILASDLCSLLAGDAKPKPSLKAVSPDVRQRLKSVVAWQDGFIEVPGSDDGKRLDFIAGKGRSARQFSCRQHSEMVLSISALVTNWHASYPVTSSATARLILVINKRLRWTRLARRGTAIEAEATVPIDAFEHKTWAQVRRALDQTVASCRESVRMIQQREVAEVFEQCV